MTSSKPPVSSSSTFKTRSPSLQSQPSQPSPRTSPTTPKFGLNPGGPSPLLTPVPTPTISGYKHEPPGSSSNADHHQYRLNQDLKFSTADRTILQELKRNISARAAHFVIKGRGYRLPGGDISPGKKYHAYPREQVPYPRSYDREVVDL
ncbi:hypothetical protein BDQ17DRAFT_1342994 [Cyathus striatus]|nr:hypothetical protein BDQ17DRAFT_1342994 [Cyathus striatus]